MGRRVEFIEIDCQSVLNRVRGMPFKWTINPYRGCQHACLYCYARNTHTYLGYDAGADFDSRIIVKRNAPVVLRAELRRPTWRRELVLLGANVDVYQPAERHYGITRQVVRALRDHLTPVNILTKSPLVLRDLDLLADLARLGLVRVNFSIGTLDEALAARVEPGAPSPARRLDALSRLAAAGIPTGAMLAPLMPGLNDAPEQVEPLVRALVEAGADVIHPIVLHLRPGAREWFLDHLRQFAPQHLARYEALYRGSYAPKQHSEAVLHRVVALRDRCLPQRVTEQYWSRHQQRGGQLELALA